MTLSAPRPIIALRDVQKYYSDYHALRGITAEIQQGEFVELCDSTLTDEYWAAIEKQYKLEEDFKLQFEAYAGRPLNLG